MREMLISVLAFVITVSVAKAAPPVGPTANVIPAVEAGPTLNELKTAVTEAKKLIKARELAKAKAKAKAQAKARAAKKAKLHLAYLAEKAKIEQKHRPKGFRKLGRKIALFTSSVADAGKAYGRTLNKTRKDLYKNLLGE